MADETQRVYALLRTSEQELLDRWVDVAAASMRGRLTRAELEHSSRDLLAALTPALDLGGLDIRSDAYATARALLDEMSRNRARRGFSPSETATEVFALKEALFAVADVRGETSETIVAVSRWVDALGSTRSSCSRAPGSR
jgi:rsbT co-antagonist protein RsbR